MRELTAIPDAPPAELRYKPRYSVLRSLKEVWAHGELLATLVEREFRIRYKQAFLGFAWSLAQPVSLVFAFTVFRRGAAVETGGTPYVLFAFLGLLPWSLFSSAVSNGGLSLFNNVALLNKVYCPREVFPLAAIGVAIVDTLIGSLALVFMFIVTGTMPRSTVVWMPVLWVIQLMFTTAVTLVISALVVHVRDIRHVLPVVLPAGLFLNPIALPLDRLIPKDWQVFYSCVNPLGPVMEGYRRVVLYGLAPQWHLLGPAALSAGIALFFGLLIFRRLEVSFADLI